MKIVINEFNDIFYVLTNHLYCQQNLIMDMWLKCPKVSIIWWMALGYTCKWLFERRVRILQYIAEDDPSHARPNWWQVVIAGVSAISEQVNITFIKLPEQKILFTIKTRRAE